MAAMSSFHPATVVDVASTALARRTHVTSLTVTVPDHFVLFTINSTNKCVNNVPKTGKTEYPTKNYICISRKNCQPEN